jgi:hypothetical protein
MSIKVEVSIVPYYETETATPHARVAVFIGNNVSDPSIDIPLKDMMLGTITGLVKNSQTKYMHPDDVEHHRKIVHEMRMYASAYERQLNKLKTTRD